MELIGQLDTLDLNSPNASWIRGWVAAIAGLDVFEKRNSLVCLPCFEPRATIPYPSRYTAS
jgi:hypothetical protein